MNTITIYAKNYCPYCKAAKQLLRQQGLNFTELEVDKNEVYLQEMLIKSHGKRTVPQIFFGNQHIGGFDDLQKLAAQSPLKNYVK